MRGILRAWYSACVVDKHPNFFQRVQLIYMHRQSRGSAVCNQPTRKWNVFVQRSWGIDDFHTILYTFNSLVSDYELQLLITPLLLIQVVLDGTSVIELITIV